MSTDNRKNRKQHKRAIAELHSLAMERETRARLSMEIGHLHDAHTQMDVARSFRMAANHLDGVSGAGG